jgi:hypothetical protein
MEDNYIIWRGITHAAATAILTDFADLYRGRDAVKKGIRLYRKSADKDAYLILFNEVADFDIFSFLVNYIYNEEHNVNYPFVRGYFKTKLILSGRDKIGGNRVMVYISKHDTEYDNVFFTDEAGKHFINDFGRGIKRIDGPEEPYVFMAYDLNEYEHVADISPRPKGHRHTPSTRKKPWWKIW